MEKHFRTCPLCEAMCGIEIEHSDGVIAAIRGDREDPFSQGHLCPKAVALQDIQDDPDRLRQPLRRTADGWQEISWEEALSAAAQGLLAVRQRHGGDALAVYAGNPTVHHTGAMLMWPLFIKALGARQKFSATSVDQLPAMLAALKMYGHQLLLPVPDLDRTDYFLCIGANPAASQGSLMSAGDVMTRLQRLRQRGGRVVVIDPRRSETADKADEHHFLRPGSDALLLAAMIHTILVEGWARPERLRDLTQGWEHLLPALDGLTPEAVADSIGMPATTVRRLAHDFAQAPRAIAYGRVGTCTQAFGGLTAWLLQVLNIVTGNLDRPGGVMFTHPAIDPVGLGLQAGGFARFHSRVRQLPEFGGELPVATLADEILTPGTGQIRALVTHAGNPVLSAPDGRRLDRALGDLEFMVAIDLYLNETTRHADIILPPAGPLEQGHYDLIFNMLAVRNVARYSPPMLPLPATARQDFDILAELARRLSSTRGARRLWSQTLHRGLAAQGMEGVLDLLLRTGPYGKALPGWPTLLARGQRFTAWIPSVVRQHRLSRALVHTPLGRQTPGPGLSLEELRRHPHGIDLGPLRVALPQRLLTHDQRIDLMPTLYRDDLPRLRRQLQQPTPRWLLIGRRHLRSNNSWMHNARRLIKGPERCQLLMHPADAARQGWQEGQKLRISSRVGALEVGLALSERMMPGVVSLPHGYGHDRPGTRLTVAQQRPGVSFNDLCDSSVVDALSGTAVLNGFAVDIVAVD